MLNTKERRKYRVRNSIIQNNKSSRHRIVVSRSNKNIYAQIVDINGKTILQESSIKIDDKISGVKKAQLVGKNLAKKCHELNVNLVVFDKGPYIYNGRVKALADACRESGLQF
jgi:large subunit ribosomal protein L18